MEALAVSTTFGLGLLFLYDALVRPEKRGDLGARAKSVGPRITIAVAAATVAYLGTSWPIAGLAAGVIGGAVPGALRRSKEDRARLDRREAVAEVSSRLRDSIRSGIGIADALAHVAQKAPPGLQRDLRRMVAEARVWGIPKAADSFAERMSDPSADLLASAISTSERLGSRNLSEVLDALAEATTAQAGAVREARARQTRNRISARIVAAVPLLLLLAIRGTNPEYLSPFAQPIGQAVLAFAFALMWGGYVLMRRAARIDRGVG